MATAQWQQTGPGLFSQVDGPADTGVSDGVEEGKAPDGGALQDASRQPTTKLPSDARKNLVRQLTEEVKKARAFWAPVFRRIREDIEWRWCRARLHHAQHLERVDVPDVGLSGIARQRGDLVQDIRGLDVVVDQFRKAGASHLTGIQRHAIPG